MHDFGKVAYLGVHKTGSSFITRFLRRNLLLQEVSFAKHAPVGNAYNPDTFYFISARDPLAQYISLYRYGLDGRGGLFHQLLQSGHGELYQPDSIHAFEKWLAWMLDPKTAHLLSDKYQKAQPGLYGFQTFRFLNLSFQHPGRALRQSHDKRSLYAAYQAEKVHSWLVRTEHMNADLEHLAVSILGEYFKPPARIRRFLQNSGKKNVSKAGAHMDWKKISPDLRAHIKAREWFLYNHVLGQQFAGRKELPDIP